MASGQCPPIPARYRFASVPNSLQIIPNFDEVETRKKDFWRHLDDGGKKLRIKSKEIVVTYAPVQWQSLLLDTVELMFRHFDKCLSFLTRRMSSYSNHRTNSVIGNNTTSSTGQFQGTAAFQTALLSCLLIIFCFIAYSFVLKIILYFVLPLYAAFNVAYWFFQWRRKYDIRPSSSLSSSIGVRRNSDNDVSGDVVKLLYFCCLVDLTIIIVGVFAIDSSYTSYAQISILHVLPLISYVTAKFVVSFYVETTTTTTSSVGDNDIISSFNNYYFATFFAVRLFVYKGLVLVPWFARSYFAYLSIYLALKSVENAAHKLENNVTAVLATANNVPGGKAVSFCANCSASPPQVGYHHHSSSGTRSPTSTQSPMHAVKQFTKLSSPADGAEVYQRHQSSLLRPSRRVSLPAGSLMPVKTQNNLGEARGLIAELLSQKDLPPHIVTGLKALINLLNPNQAVPTVSDLLANLPLVVETPFIGEQLSLAASPVTWSTVTSATGLPTFEPEPNRSRSSSYWKQKHPDDDTPPSPTDDIEASGNLKEQLCQKISLESTDSLLQTPDGTLFDIDELEHDEMLSNLRQWSLLIFDLHAASQNTLLSRVAYSVFRQSRLFNIFKIARQKFFNFFHALEQGYWHIPYHNSIHATDVMHATFYFTSNKIPAISENDEGLSNVLSSLELLALYTAAGMHDYDHPGRTNAFLVATGDSKALLYNDRSVLENHHAAAAWKLLTLPHNNFVENLDSAEYKRLRYIVMEAILATDLKRHFEILVEFNDKVSGRGLDWENEADKLLVTQVCIKMADINSPTKPFDLHIQWTNRILDEFYAQGDAEREQGLPVSAFMDRNEPQVAKLQDSFIAHLVKPMVQAMHTAGLLPQPSEDEDISESELLLNIEENHKYWKNQLGECSPFVDLNVNQIEFENEQDSAGEMETIEEDDDENT